MNFQVRGATYSQGNTVAVEKNVDLLVFIAIIKFHLQGNYLILPVYHVYRLKISHAVCHLSRHVH